MIAVPEQLTTAQWSERYRRVTQGPMVGRSGTAVRWSNATFPLQLAIMDAIDSPRWPTVAVMGPPQAGGKTDCAAVNPILKAIHQDHRDCLYMSANADKAYDQWAKKFESAIIASPDLACLRSEYRDDTGTKRRRDFVTGPSLFFAGAESIANLSGSTIPVVVCDDVQAMPPKIGALGHPVDVAFTRTGSLSEDQCVKVLLGTAGTVDDYLFRVLQTSTFYRPYLPCLTCGTYQLIDFERFTFDRDDPVAAAADAYMRCANDDCDHPIRDTELPEMLRRFVWVGRGQTVEKVGVRATPSVSGDLPRTRVAGYWWNAFYWPFVRWGQHCAAWVECAGDPDRAKNFQQHILVQPWEEKDENADALRPEDVTGQAVATHHWRTVPDTAGVARGAGTVIVTTDVQAGYLWYLVEAWSKPTGTAWFVEAGRFGSTTGATAAEIADRRQRVQAWMRLVSKALGDLWAKIDQGWPIVTAAGEVVGTAKAARVLVDCGFLREVVQNFCKLRNGGAWVGTWLPVEGSTAKAASAMPIWPGLNRSVREKKSGRRYFECNTNRAKLYVRDLLAVPAGQGGSLVLPGDMPAFVSDAFSKHLCAEEWQADKGAWKQVSGANHLLDCQGMQICGAICEGVKLGRETQDEATPAVVTDWFRRSERKN